MTKKIAILGATGSVGTQALDVARERGYTVDALTVGRNIGSAENIVREFSPRFVAVADETLARDLAVRIADTGTKVLGGDAGSESLVFSCLDGRNLFLAGTSAAEDAYVAYGKRGD